MPQSGPVVKSVVAINKWGSPPPRHGRYGQRGISPLPPTTEPVEETRRVMLKRNINDADDTRFAVRSMQSFLNENPHGDGRPLESEIGGKRLRSSVVHVVKSDKMALEPALNRTDSCPILVRVFYSTDGRHTPLSQFSNGKFPANEVEINTWPDATLKELSREILHSIRTCRGSSFKRLGRPMRLNFATVFPDPNQRGIYRKREIGSVVLNNSLMTANGNPASGDQPSDGDFTLHAKHFQIGDYLDVAISEVGQFGPRPLQGDSDRSLRNQGRASDRMRQQY